MLTQWILIVNYRGFDCMHFSICGQLLRDTVDFAVRGPGQKSHPESSSNADLSLNLISAPKKD